MTDKLYAELRGWAAGLYANTSAVELLIAADRHTNSRLLHEDRVRRRCLTRPAPGLRAVRWEALGSLARSVFEGQDDPLPGRGAQIALIACGLSGADEWPQPMHRMLSGLDRTHTLIVLNAIAHHQGIHEYRDGATMTITGHPDTIE